jgi:hypothetical protein
MKRRGRDVGVKGESVSLAIPRVLMQAGSGTGTGGQFRLCDLNDAVLSTLAVKPRPLAAALCCAGRSRTVNRG